MIKELKASNGKIVGSDEYFDQLNKAYLNGLMPNNSGRNRYYDLYRDIERNLQSKKYAYIVSKYQLTKNNTSIYLKKVFEPVAGMMKKDIASAAKDAYIKDGNGYQCNTALNQLKLCRIPLLDGTIRDVNKLCWFIHVNAEKVKKLQRLLNKLGYGPLEENGVYDTKTDKAWIKFVTEIEVGRFAKLSNQQVSGISVVIGYTEMIQIIDGATEGFIRSAATTLVNNINRSPKLVKIGTRTVIIASLALDTLELGLAIEQDLTDADKKIGKKTWATVTKIGGSWAGYFAGKGLGHTTKVVVGAVAGEPAGAITGAMVGFAAILILSEYGEKLGEYMIDLTDLE